MKKIISLIAIITILTITAGCDLKKDTMENIEIYTTNYPTEYIVKRLYKNHATIHSIYPNGIDINNYNLTKKQIEDYSKAQLYIFNGLSEKEKSYVSSMRKQNKNLKIIDDTLAMEYNYSIEELWLDPSNLLMMAQNVKKGFSEYINNYYLNNDINKNYEKLKIETSNLDAQIKEIVKNSDNKEIIVSNDLFKYLEKYGLKVYSLEDNENLTDKNLSDIENIIEKKHIKYIFIKENEEQNKYTKQLIKKYNLETLQWNTLSNLTETQKSSNENYFTLMEENLETLKNGLLE